MSRIMQAPGFPRRGVHSRRPKLSETITAFWWFVGFFSLGVVMRGGVALAATYVLYRHAAVAFVGGRPHETSGEVLTISQKDVGTSEQLQLPAMYHSTVGAGAGAGTG